MRMLGCVKLWPVCGGASWTLAKAQMGGGGEGGAIDYEVSFTTHEIVILNFCEPS